MHPGLNLVRTDQSLEDERFVKKLELSLDQDAHNSKPGFDSPTLSDLKLKEEDLQKQIDSGRRRKKQRKKAQESSESLKQTTEPSNPANMNQRK